MFNVSRAMLFRWQQKYDQGGPVALETKKTPGPASRLSPTQLSKLYAIITGSDPRQLEFDFGLWTRKIIRESDPAGILGEALGGPGRQGCGTR